MEHKSHILIVDDDEAIRISLKIFLEKNNYIVETSSSAKEAIESVHAKEFHAILSDIQMPDMDGLELLEKVKDTGIPLILMTAYGSSDTAIEAMRQGAYDYLLKPHNLDELLAILKKATQSSKAQALAGTELATLTTESKKLLGSSRPMQLIYKEIGKIAHTTISVLIQGETGTGKEIVAKAIYYNSDRNKSPFVAINCASISHSLLESELFGYEKGAFTGANRTHMGCFEQANKGTLFLDEIGEIPETTQVKLLRVLQEKAIRRIGGKKEIPLDVRIICATNINLEEAVEKGKFREDFYYRINQSIINMPPLRNRGDDIEILFMFFLRKYASEMNKAVPYVPEESILFILNHNWPGNVRELENLARRCTASLRGNLLDKNSLQENLSTKKSLLEDNIDTYLSNLVQQAYSGEIENLMDHVINDIEQKLLPKILEITKGNQSETAKILGISRPTLQKKISKLK